MLPSAVTTDATGAVTIPATYSCPASTSQVYLIARGGKAGASGTVNSGTVLALALGACGNLSSSQSFVINELTTVATAYALAPFSQPGGQIGATSTNTLGLSLAAGTVANLVNVNTGGAPGSGFPSTGTAPTARLNSLANALNACVVTPAACTALNAAASKAAGITVSNTLDAVSAIAQHPASNVPGVYAATLAASAYAPALTAAPSDWTMFVTYAGGGLNAPSGIGVDSMGNVWVASYFGKASLFSNTGTPVFPSGISGSGLNESYGLALDAADHAWIPNEQTTYAVNGGIGSVSVLNTAGQSVAGANGFSAGGLNFPVAVGMDAAGSTAWVVDYGNSHVTLLNTAGSPLSGASGYTTDLFAFPVAVAVDGSGNGYIGNQSSNAVTRVARDGSTFTNFVVGDGPSGLAVDSSNNVWTANYYGSSVGLLSAAGKVLSSGGFTGGGLNHPQGIAVDGAGTAWVTNYRAPGITALAGASASVPGAPLSPANGFGADAGLLEAFAVAIDSGGSLWVSNFGSNTVTQFVGMAAPVKTPVLGPVAKP